MRLKPTFNRSEPGVWISGVAHAAMLGTAIFAFTSPTFPEAQEGIAVEVITDNQFSQITKGEESAKAVQATPKPRVDRVAEARQLRDPGEAPKDTPAPPRRPAEMKVDEREIEAAARPDAREDARREEAARAAKAAAEARAQAEREERAKAAEAKAQAEAIEQAKAEARRVAEAKAKAKAEAEAREAAEAKADAEAKAREVADAKAKAEAEAKAKAVAAAKAKADAEAKARRQAEVADRFDAGDIRQLLQSKERAQSSGATGSEINRTASLGTAAGTAQKLNPSMRDALGGIIREQIERCYAQPVGASGNPVTLPILEIRFKADGTLLGEPKILRSGATSMERAVADAALRAVRRCAPYRIPDKFAPYYDAWKLWNVEFELGST